MKKKLVGTFLIILFVVQIGIKTTNVSALERFNKIYNKEAMEYLRRELVSCDNDAERAYAVAKTVTWWFKYDVGSGYDGVPENRKGVCWDYSEAFTRLGKLTGLDCGDFSCLSAGVSHIRNYVKIDNKYYYVDTTFADQLIFSTKFFLFANDIKDVSIIDTSISKHVLNESYIVTLINNVKNNKSLSSYDTLKKIYGEYATGDEIYNLFVESLMEDKEVVMVVKEDEFTREKFKFADDAFDSVNYKFPAQEVHIRNTFKIGEDTYRIYSVRFTKTSPGQRVEYKGVRNTRDKLINDYKIADYSITKLNTKLEIGKLYSIADIVQLRGITAFDLDFKFSNPNVLNFDKDTFTFKVMKPGITDLEIYKKDGTKVFSTQISVIGYIYPIELDISLPVGSSVNLFDYVEKNVISSDTFVKFASANPKIATVNNGIVNGVSSGYCTIKMINTLVPSNVLEFRITVTGKYNKVKSLSVDNPQIKLSVGETRKIKALVNNDATNKSINFKSLNAKIATVDKRGNVTAIGKGRTVIKVYSVENPSIHKNVSIIVK